MKILGLFLLVGLVACGKSSTSNSGSEKDPVRRRETPDCGGSLFCLTPTKWEIISATEFPQNFSIAILDYHENSEHPYVLVDTCRRIGDQVLSADRKTVSFANHRGLNARDGLKLRIINHGEKCENWLPSYNHLPASITTKDEKLIIRLHYI